jgi:hypothetical protein
MRRKIVLATLLCLATAALAVGAAPALAAGGCDCHTAIPPRNGARAAHAPLLVRVTACATCHKGMAVPHPTLVKPKLSFAASVYTTKKGESFVELAGRLTTRRGVGLDGVVVFLQQRAPGATAFVDLKTVTTHRIKSVPLTFSYQRPNGWFSARVTAPVWGATYRAVTRGVRGTKVVRPALRVTLLQAILWNGVRGLDSNGRLQLGRSVKLDGTALPAELLAGEKVKLTLQKVAPGGARVMMVGEATIGSDGKYGWEVTPTMRGRYWFVAKLLATEEHYGYTCVGPRFPVK